MVPLSGGINHKDLFFDTNFGYVLGYRNPTNVTLILLLLSIGRDAPMVCFLHPKIGNECMTSKMLVERSIDEE